MPRWTPFSYRGYYDVPRVIVLVLADGRRILLESRFDEVVDQYDDYYDVYLLLDEAALDGSWERLAEYTPEILGRVAVVDVRFDSTRRDEIDLDSLGLPELA